jgi:hypothetical protein
MGLFVLASCVFILIGGYKLVVKDKDWWMYVYLPPLVLVIPFGLAMFFNSIHALWKGSWGRTWDRNVHPMLVAAAFLLVAFLIGVAIGYFRCSRRN